jgi:hypothetical protein
MNQKYGLLRSWHEDRGFGIIWVSRTERYLLHITRVLEPDIPVAGCGVYFDPALPFKAGGLPLAINARIVQTTEGEGL